MTQPKANQWIHCLLPCLERALTAVDEMPSRSIDAVTWETEARFYFHDGTERPIQRPKEAQQQGQYYSTHF